MEVFINGIGNISAQKTVDKTILQEGFIQLSGNRFHCIEPDYSAYIDSKQIRRMSRIIKMGVATSILAMKEAELNSPEAIIVGTSMGCLEDTNSFLSKMVQYKEEMLSPTAFIHSTHNSIAAQVALIFQCKVYNSTYVHRTISFESALLDAIMLMEEGTVENALVAGIDEFTDSSFTIMNRLGHFKENENNQAENFYSPGKGSIGGEGSAFFVLSTKKSAKSYAKIIATQTLSFCSVEEMANAVKLSLKENNITEIDLLLIGNNADEEDDLITNEFTKQMNLSAAKQNYKHLCGEYATSTAFAMAMASEILKDNSIAEKYGYSLNKEIKNILIYNQSKGIHQSSILLSSC